ncbi:hypothetical protein [Pedobacter sandarakinus]|uniref:hypothetical protein n=1 Tax=Pedobacter sandarakinus TaxID=353156 RepID=UPI0022460A75|nr:hypothetical protein [Pedobacter sandarakinus]MCX2575289.1 hypothetical protein [Pedobacter sandarakinus]
MRLSKMITSNGKYSCVIVGDEFRFLILLKEYISLIPKMKLSGSFLTSVPSTIDFLDEEPIDFLILDIGMEISRKNIMANFGKRVKHLIIITNDNENTLDIFDENGNGILIKPVAFESFAKTINLMISKERRNLNRDNS